MALLYAFICQVIAPTAQLAGYWASATAGLFNCLVKLEKSAKNVVIYDMISNSFMAVQFLINNCPMLPLLSN